MSNPSYQKNSSQLPTLPTHAAALRNDVSLLAEYIREGYEVIDEENGENPFHSAARGGSIEAIEWLLENRPSDLSPRHKANNGHTPAHAAAVYNHMEALKMILEYDKVKGGLMAADQDENGLTILHLAVLQGDGNMVKYILKNYPHLAFCANENGDLPVHFAAASGYLEIIKILVDASGNHIVNEKDSNGTTAVYFAAQEGKLDCLKYFIEELKCDPISQDNEGMTLLHAATQEGHFEMVQFLVSKMEPRSIKIPTNDGATVVHAAADVGAIEILDWLLCQPGCKELVNYQDTAGYTPSHDAVEADKIQSLRVLLHHGADLTLKNIDGKTPYDSAHSESMSKFLRDYKAHGRSFLVEYKGTNLGDSDTSSVKSSPSERRTRTRSSTRTSVDEQMEISDARRVVKEVIEKREMRRQGSLQAMQDVGRENSQEDLTGKVYDGSEGPAMTGPQDDLEHYKTEGGAIYARVKKTSRSKNDYPPNKGISPKKVKKNSSGGNLSDLSDFSSPLSQQLSPHGRTSRTRSPLADTNDQRHGGDDDLNSLYSDWTSVSHRANSHLPPESRTNLSEYSESLPSRRAHMGHPPVGPAYRGYPPMYPPHMYQPHPYQPRSVEERMRMEAMRGKYPMPQHYPYAYHYPPPMAFRGRGQGYPYMPYPYMHPGYYQPYRPPGPGVPRSKSAGSGGIGKPSKSKPKDKTKQSKKKGDVADTRSESRFTGANMEIGYGPSTTDGPGGDHRRPASGKGGKRYNDIPENFHPPPPPSTKGGEMKEFVEHGNFIMVKRTPDSHGVKVHPSGVALHPAKNMKEYDGRYDDFIEPDPYEEEIDEHFNIGVLIEAATVAIIGSVVGIKDLRASMVSMKRKNKSKKTSGQRDKVADSGGKLTSNTPKKIKSFQDLWGGGDFEQQMENMSEHEKYALMLSDHTPTTWGAEEEEEKPQEVKRRTPQKSKATPDGSPYLTDMVKTLSKQYSASRTSLNTLGTNTGSLGGDLGMSIQARQSSLLNLAATETMVQPYGVQDEGEESFDEVESRIQGKTEAEIKKEKIHRKSEEKRRSTEDPRVAVSKKKKLEDQDTSKTKGKKKAHKKNSKQATEDKTEKKDNKETVKVTPRVEDSSQEVEEMEITFGEEVDGEMPPLGDSGDETTDGKKNVVDTGLEFEVSQQQHPNMTEAIKVDQLHAVDITMETQTHAPPQPSPPLRGPEMKNVTPEPQPDVSVVAEVVVPVETTVTEKTQTFDADEVFTATNKRKDEEKPKRPKSKTDNSSSTRKTKEEDKASRRRSTTKEGEKSSSRRSTSKTGEHSSRSSKEKEHTSKKSKTKANGEEKSKRSSTSEHKKTSKKTSSTDEVKEEVPDKFPFGSTGLQFPVFDFGFETGIETSKPVPQPSPQPPISTDPFEDDIFGDLTASDSMGDLLKNIEDQIKEMESMSKKPKEPTKTNQSRSATSGGGGPGGTTVTQDLAQELMKLGEIDLSSPLPTTNTPAQQPETTPAESTPSQNSSIIEHQVVDNLLQVNKMLAGNSLSAQEVFQYQVQHNQLVSEIIKQALAAKDKGMDTLTLAHTVAIALSQLDRFTISQVLAGLNQAKSTSGSLSDLKQSGLDASDSSLSLTSEIETAIRKFQEEQMKEQQKQFKSQSEFQEFMKRQVEEQSKVYLQMQEQSKLYVEMQIQQAQALADAQKKMNEQEMRLRRTEERLKAQMSTRDVAAEQERDQKMKELEMKVKMYEEMKQQQESYHKQFHSYYESKMEEMMKKMMEGGSTEGKKKKKKKKSAVPIDDISSSDDELVPAMPSLKQQILQHAEAKEHQARIYRNDMLTEDSVREFAESKIPYPPPVPSQSYLLGRFKRSDTKTRVTAIQKSFSRFEKGDDESDSSGEEGDFVKPVQIGGTKKASLKHTELNTAVTETKVVIASQNKTNTAQDSGAQAKMKKIGAPDESQFEKFDYIQKKPPKQLDPPPASEPQPVKNRFLDNQGGGINKINAHKTGSEGPDHDLEGAGNELKAILEKRRKNMT